MLIDTHSHLNFKAFEKDRSEVIKRSLKEGVFMINVGSNYETSELAVEIAEKYQSGVFSAVGLHPIHTQTISNLKFQISNLHTKSKNFKTEDFDYKKFKKLAQSSKKVVAIGETGLDAMYPNQSQEDVFLEHLKLAKELDLPVILHCRKAHQNLIKILKNYQFSIPNFQSIFNNQFSNANQKQSIKQSKIRGVVHCFTGKWSEAKEYLEMGLYLGFNGIVFKHNVAETIKKMPLDKILIETDCPYLTPPQESDKRNEPVFVKYVAQRIAEIRGETIERVAEITAQNAKALFKIKS